MKKTRQQDGFVSIFSVLIIMAVLTLITVGFAALSQRAQRRTLDDQLSAQAYYAAESGVNDAIEYINENPEYTKEDCGPGGPFDVNDYQIDPANGVEYTCLLVTLPDSLKFDNTKEAIGYLERKDGKSFTEVKFSWDNQTRGGITDQTSGFPDKETWSDNVTPLRVELVPVKGGGGVALDRGTLVQNSYVFYLYPTSANISTDNSFEALSGTSEKGAIFTVKCDENAAGHRCSATVEPDRADVTAYVVRVSGLYSEFSLDIEPTFNSQSGGLRGGQLNVDVTGKANDVFRRVQVQVPVFGPGSTAWGLRDVFGVLAADSICKRYFVGPGFPASVTDVDHPGDDSFDSACSID